MISLKLKTNLIDKNRIFRGAKHTYLDLILIENRNGRDEYGYDGIAKQKLTAAELEQTPRPELPIVGNFTIIDRSTKRQDDHAVPFSCKPLSE
jgi:hypothetical protein